jgi:HK97 family phage prohead protease
MATRSEQARSALLPVAEERPTDWRTVELADLELRAEGDDDGPHFRGWACRSGVLDAYGTTFAAGCWAAGGLDDQAYALCWMHDPWVPVGVFTAAERSTGLWIEGRWDQTRDGRDGRTKAKTGSAPALSVGFRSAIFDEDEPNKIVAARLVEVSQITARMAAVPGSKFTESRSTPEKDHQSPGGPLPVARRSLIVARARLRGTSLIT